MVRLRSGYNQWYYAGKKQESRMLFLSYRLNEKHLSSRR